MPLITTCPACQAKFVVSAAQLEAHHGDVRCGKCKHVFNALGYLESLADVENTSVEPPVASTTDIDKGATEESFDDTEDLQGALFIEEVSPDKESITAQTETELAEKDTEEETTASANITAEPTSASNKTTVIPAFDAANFQLETAADTQSINKTKAKAKSQESQASEEPSVLDKQPKNFVWVGWLLLVILLILAALQTTYYFRTEISAQYPQLKPLLVQACNTLGCKIELPKQADLLVIDDSDLQEDAEREGLIRLNTTLLNRAEYALAYPLLEITLTDASDKVLMRKRFKPSEYLPPETPLAEGIPGNDSVYVHLALTANKHAVSGYRLFITY